MFPPSAESSPQAVVAATRLQQKHGKVTAARCLYLILVFIIDCHCARSKVEMKLKVIFMFINRRGGIGPQS